MFVALRRFLLDPAFLVALGAALVSAVLLYELRGLDAVGEAVAAQLGLFEVLLVFVPAVLLLSALFQVLAPRGLIERWLGAGAGFRGILVATLAGAFTPGGPFLAFPLVYALYRAGADWGPLVAYVTSWSLLSIMRTLVFEIPFVGVELPAVRYVASFTLPLLAGLAARHIARIYRPPADLVRGPN